MLEIHPIPAYQDNYIWCIHNHTHAYLIDPGQAEPALAFLKDNHLQLCGILITHYHWDHITGIKAIIGEHGNISVWGPRKEAIPGKTNDVKNGDMIRSLLDLTFEVIETPGHTLGHVIYFVESSEIGPLLFCGDTLFSSGCGRLFEGTPEQMYTSLQRIKQLPVNTTVFCTHEYTQANLAFAQAVEPDSEAIQLRISEVNKLRQNNLPSLPTTLSMELEINPFIRTNIPQVVESIIQNCGGHPANEAQAFAKLRAWKDRF